MGATRMPHTAAARGQPLRPPASILLMDARLVLRGCVTRVWRHGWCGRVSARGNACTDRQPCQDELCALFSPWPHRVAYNPVIATITTTTTANTHTYLWGQSAAGSFVPHTTSHHTTLRHASRCVREPPTQSHMRDPPLCCAQLVSTPRARAHTHTRAHEVARTRTHG